MATRLLVTGSFEGYRPGDRITAPKEIERVTEVYPDFVLREAISADTQPSKAEVKAAGVPPETAVRVASGLPAQPLPAPAQAATATAPAAPPRPAVPTPVSPTVTPNVALKG